MISATTPFRWIHLSAFHDQGAGDQRESRGKDDVVMLIKRPKESGSLDCIGEDHGRRLIKIAK